MKKILTLLLTFALVFSLAPATFSAPTIFIQGDQYEQGAYKLEADQPTSYNWTRQSRFKSIDADPYIKWTFNPEGAAFWSTVAIDSDGTIYAGDSNNCDFYAINPDGTEKWKYTNDRCSGFDYTTSPVIGSDGTIYVGSQGLHAITAEGEELWYKHFNGRVNGISIDEDGKLYVITNGNNLRVIESRDGSEIRNINLGSTTSYGVPAISKEGNIYIGTLGSLMAFDKEGNRLWSFNNASNSGYGSPAIGHDGTIYMGRSQGTTIGYLYAVNPDGTEKWSYRVGSSIRSTPAIDKDGTIIFATYQERKVYALNPDGTLKWSVDQGSMTMSPILDSSGNVYMMSQSNLNAQLFAYTREGEYLWDISRRGSHASPSIGSDGTIYLSTVEDGITAIGGTIEQPFDFCATYSKLKLDVNSGLETQREVDEARGELNKLYEKLQELEEKINEAEANL